MFNNCCKSQPQCKIHCVTVLGLQLVTTTDIIQLYNGTGSGSVI